VVAGNHETTYRIFDTVLKAIGTMDPDVGYAAGEGGANVLNYQSKQSGKMNYTVMGGGWGALRDRDGLNAKRSGPGNTGIQPVERIEEDYDYVTIEERAIVPGTGGAGKHRGGCTSRRVVQFSDDVEILLASERAKTAPFGVAGGGEGSRARHVHVTPEGDGIELHSKLAADLKAGSRLLVQPAGGGGYGDPMERPPEAVLADVLDGYVSIGDARDKYGVVIDSDSMTVDEKATTERRRD